MNKTIKKITISVLVAFLTLCLLSASILFSSTKVSAAVDVDADSVAVSGFTMENGASIREIGSEAGIRWTTNVSADFEQAIADAYPDATVAYKTLVTGVNMLPAGGDVTDVTPDLLKVNDANDQNDEELACKILTGSLSGGKFTGSIIYNVEDNPTEWEAIKDAAIKADLIARSYVEITPTSGSPVIIYAKADDSVRNMQGVAVHALAIGDNTEIADDYIASVTASNPTVVPYYHYKNDANIMVGVGSTIPNGDYTAYTYAKKASAVTVTDGNIAGLSNVTVEKGKTEHPLYLVDSQNVAYSVNFINPTLIITDKSGFEYFKTGVPTTVSRSSGDPYTTFDGYYVLGNDITWTGNWVPSGTAFNDFTGDNDWTASANHYKSGLTGVFDGRGHIVEGSFIVGGGGLFGIIGDTGVVKNVGFSSVKVTDGGQWHGANFLAHCIFEGATVENVYINFVNNWANGKQLSSVLAAYVHPQSNLSKLVIKYSGEVVNAGRSAFAGTIPTSSLTKETLNETNWSNVFVTTNQALTNTSVKTVKVTAENETLVDDAYGLKGIWKYANKTDLKVDYDAVDSKIKAGIDSFDNKYWVKASSDGEFWWRGSSVVGI